MSLFRCPSCSKSTRENTTLALCRKCGVLMDWVREPLQDRILRFVGKLLIYVVLGGVGALLFQWQQRKNAGSEETFGQFLHVAWMHYTGQSSTREASKPATDPPHSQELDRRQEEQRQELLREQEIQRQRQRQRQRQQDQALTERLVGNWQLQAAGESMNFDLVGFDYVLTFQPDGSFIWRMCPVGLSKITVGIGETVSGNTPSDLGYWDVQNNRLRMRFTKAYLRSFKEGTIYGDAVTVDAGMMTWGTHTFKRFQR
jgi:hypothetical protein